MPKNLITKIQCKMIGLISPNRGVASIYDILPSQVSMIEKVFSNAVSAFSFKLCPQEVDGSKGLVITKYRLDIKYIPEVV